jgi:hypothetical protein
LFDRGNPDLVEVSREVSSSTRESFRVVAGWILRNPSDFGVARNRESPDSNARLGTRHAGRR